MADPRMLWLAPLLGLVEGLTEFLPVSSTGHLILTSHLAGFEGKRAELFEVFIQLGAILAVVWEYRGRLLGHVLALPRSAESRSFAARIALAFVPFAALGFVAYPWIVEHLFSPRSVAYALVAGALLIFAVEALPHRKLTATAEQASWTQALCIGLAQCLALWPGFSRAAATILGGLTVGLERRAATEFSFFLAIPTMLGATVFSLGENRDALGPGDGGWLVVAFLVAFLVAWASIRWLLRFVSSHTFRPFAWYRLTLGLAILTWMA